MTVPLDGIVVVGTGTLRTLADPDTGLDQRLLAEGIRLRRLTRSRC
jgi:hypothetical protein